MTQEAIVTKLLPNGMAEVAVTRTTACGGNCGSCESCIFQNELKTSAKNLIQAMPGQRVLIESRSSRIYGAALLVYIMPLVLLLLGYALAVLLALPEWAAVLLSFAGLLLGAVIVVLSQRRKGKNENRKASKVIISCLSFQQKKIPYRSLIIHEDFEGLSSFYRNQITNAADKQFATLDDFRTGGMEYIERELAS